MKNETPSQAQAVNPPDDPPCVQCCLPMEYGIVVQDQRLFVCIAPDCPNYGLVQVGNIDRQRMEAATDES